jgi:hypothetical protein
MVDSGMMMLLREYSGVIDPHSGQIDPFLFAGKSSSQCSPGVTALNLRRIFNILPKNVLQTYLKGLAYIFGRLFVLLGFHSFVLPKALLQSHSAALFFVPRSQLIKMRYIRW